jgi:hypothetical protein
VLLPQKSSNILTLMVIIVFFTGIDYLLTNLQIEFNKIFFPLLLVSFLFTIIILAFSFWIWKIILTEESMEKSRHRNLLLGAAILTLIAGFTSLLIYLIEIILSSGFLGTAYFDLGLTANQNETGIVPSSYVYFEIFT